MKIVIGNKTQQSNYFEVAYTFTLDVPQAQVGKESQAVTKEVTGVAPYKDDTDIKAIQDDLIVRYSKAQAELNAEKKLDFYGMTFDGIKWGG
jgi:hypothetical protein